MIKKLIVLTLIVLSLIYSAVMIIQSDAFKDYALTKLNEYIEKSSNGRVKFEKIEVSFPFTLVLKNISLDAIRIEDAKITLSLRKLLNGQFKIKHLLIQNFDVETKEHELELGNNESVFVFPKIFNLFSSFKLEKLEVRNLKIQNHLIDIVGSVRSNTDDLSLNFDLDIMSLEFSKIKAQISIKNEDVDLIANISLSQLQNDIQTLARIRPNFTIEFNNLKANIANFSNCRSNHLTLSLNPFILSGKISGQVQDFHYNKIETEGKVSFQAHLFSNEEKNQNMKLLLKSKVLKSFGLEFNQVLAKVLFLNVFDSYSVDLDILAKEASKTISEQDYKLLDVSFKNQIDKNNEFSTFHLACNHLTKKNKIETSGEYGFIDDQLMIQFKDFQGIFCDKPFHSHQVFSLKIKEDSLETTPLHFSYGKSFIQTSFKTDFKNIDWTADLHDIPSNLLSQEIRSGMWDAKFHFSGDYEKPEGQIDLTFHQLKLSKSNWDYIPPVDAQILINAKEHGWQMQGEIKEQNQNPVSFHAILPVSFSSSPFLLHLDPKKNIFAHFSLDGELAPLIEILKGSTSNLFGRAKIEVEVNGTLEEPHFKATGEIIEATFEIPETGALYKNINASIQSYDSHLELIELTATDAFQGKVRGHGNVELNLEALFPFDFKIEIQNTKLLRLDYASAEGNGLLTLTGDLNGALLAGKVIAEEAKVRIPEESKILVHSVDVTYINQESGDVERLNYTQDASYWPIKLDLDFEVKHPFSIKGADLKSQWKGALKIKGTSQNPELFGEFKLIDGEYKFNGKLFEIQEGTISFTGEPDKKTSLYVIGSKEIGNLKADVILKGPLKSPAISFRSNPPMPQREIVSWILFGHGAQDLNAFQGSQLNRSIKDLKNNSKGPDFLTKIRNKIGIDTIDINHNSESESNEVSIKVGKYISRGILVSVNKSISADANRLAIEAKVFKDFKVQAEIGDDAEGQLNLKWKRDY